MGGRSGNVAGVPGRRMDRGGRDIVDGEGMRLQSVPEHLSSCDRERSAVATPRLGVMLTTAKLGVSVALLPWEFGSWCDGIAVRIN